MSTSGFPDLPEAPFSYFTIPLLSILVAAGVGFIYYRKRRRQQLRLRNGQWPSDTTHSYTSAAQRRQRRQRSNGAGRWAPWGTRSEEGLNELGEAPPPYDGKREGEGTVDTYEMELEAGVRPPEYPDQPRPVHTRATSGGNGPTEEATTSRGASGL